MALPVEALNIITAVKYDADLINAVNHMTFLFDPNWQGIGNTLPVCFFYVKDFKEVLESEISQKSLLFYNSQNSDNPNAVAGGLLGIVADNIINKPKKYQMSIIIPRTVEVYLQQSIFSKRVNLADLFRGNQDEPILQTIDLIARSTQDLIAGILKVLGLPSVSIQQTLNVDDFASFVTSATQDDSNKASLDAMWENRTILKMKYWNGWRFKYVVIESYMPSKDGTEDGCYEATLNVTEIPILTVRKQSKIKLPKTTALGDLVKQGKLKVVSDFMDKLDKDGFKGGIYDV